MMTLAMIALLQVVQVPTYEAHVAMVGVTVSAVDATSGTPVLDLKPDDFDVREEGKHQNIVYFQREEVPASVIIMLDTSISMSTLAQPIREAGANLIRSLRSIDEVQVATFGDRYRILSDFTTDHDAAIASLGEIQAGEMTPLNRSVYMATRFLELQHRGDVKRRRILILLSDGEDTDGSFSYESAEDAIRRSLVTCYVVHIQRGNLGNVLTLSGKQMKSLSERANKFVETITYETGGRLLHVPAPFSPKIIAGAFSGIATDIASQYHLGYVLNGGLSVAGWREVSVGLRTRVGVQIRFRRGYYAHAQE